MKRVQFLFAFCLMLLVHVCAYAQPEQDFNLIELLQKKEISLIVLRHGEAIHNLTYMISSSPTPGLYLTEVGKEQTKQVANDLASLKVNAVYVSPLYRALQTAQMISKILRVPYYKVVVDKRLREQYYGLYEERTYEEFKNYFSTKELMFTDAVPEGELGVDVFERLRHFLWTVAHSNQQATVLVVTHGLNCSQINKCLTGHYDEIPELGDYRIYDFRTVSEQ